MIEWIRQAGHLLVGVFLLVLVSLWCLLSIPVYLFRLLVAHIIAPWRRPDLGPILDFASASLAADYLDTNTAPRSNYVITLYLQNSPERCVDVVKESVQRSWIEPGSNPGSYYRKFLQYPEIFMGFPFWKNCTSFSLDQHVSWLSEAREDELDEMVEKLLNSHFPRGQSPWSILVVENYFSADTNSAERQSVLLVNIHHCLSDGFGMLYAIVQGLCNQNLENLYEKRARQLRPTFWQALRFWASFPLVYPLNGARIFSYTLMNHACKVSDAHKTWHQVVARSPPISMATVKEIRNAFGVSFSSVLICALFSAIRRAHEQAGQVGRNEKTSVVCINVLPLGDPAKRKALTNYCTGAIVKIPLLSCETNEVVERLWMVHRELETTRHSTTPFAFQALTMLTGMQCLPVISLLSSQKWVSVGITNFAGMPHVVRVQDTVAPGMRVTRTECHCGALRGNAGLTAMLLSHGNEIRIKLTPEKALFSKNDLSYLASVVMDEVGQLSDMANATESNNYTV